MALAADAVGARYIEYSRNCRVQAEGQIVFAEAVGADHVSVISDPADLDYPVDMALSRVDLGPDQTIAGNIDPVRVLCDTDPATIRCALASCLFAVGKDRYIVGAGCEVPRGTPRENIVAMKSFAMEAIGI